MYPIGVPRFAKGCASPRDRRSGAMTCHVGGPPLPRLRESPSAELALAMGLRHPDVYGAVLCASPGGGYPTTCCDAELGSARVPRRRHGGVLLPPERGPVGGRAARRRCRCALGWRIRVEDAAGPSSVRRRRTRRASAARLARRVSPSPLPPPGSFVVRDGPGSSPALSRAERGFRAARYVKNGTTAVSPRGGSRCGRVRGRRGL